MPRKRADQTEDLPHGTYEIPGVGLIVNGTLLDSNDPEAVETFHNKDTAGREQSAEAIAERDAVIVESVNAPVEPAPEE